MNGRASLRRMFTGLVQDIGIVRGVTHTQGDLRVDIETGLDLGSMALGASICCSGCCLTIVEKTTSIFTVDISAESLSRTNFKSWKIGSRVNLEPSLKLGDELGGHFVFGHVDAVVEIIDVEVVGGSHKLRFFLPEPFKHLVAEKGSVALEGVSLTVNRADQNCFDVNIIPHTWNKTTLGFLKAGMQVNFEADMLARYVSRIREFT